MTGGTGGLGRAVVDAFADDGWRVVAPARGDAREAPREGVEVVRADLADEADVATVVDAASGIADAPLTAVLNLVGGYAGGARVHEAPVQDFEAQLRLNLRPTYLVTQAALPHLLAAGGGSIVCVSSRAALRPFSGAAGYVAAKAAVLAFVQAVDAEYRDEGIRCNAVVPSVIDTPANRAAQPNADTSRWVAPEEIARVIRFLCSEASAPLGGAAVPVYGRA